MHELVLFPANANVLNKVIVLAANFEFVRIGDFFTGKLFYFPETDPISLGAEQCEIGSSFLVDNLGTKYWAA